jgi:hypothetical protein
MKCFAAFFILGFVGLPLAGGFIYLLIKEPRLMLVIGFALALGASIAAISWAIHTAYECLNNL